MKPVFNLFILAFASFAFTSCSKYYINTIESANILKDEKTGVFRFENDSIKLTYSFFGENAPIQIAVQNKMAIPLYIDWSKSALILNDKAVSYSGNKVLIAGTFSADSYSFYQQSRYTDGSIDASAALPESVTFIPPSSMIDRTPLYLTNSDFNSLPDSAYKAKEYIYPAQGVIKVKAAYFTRDNSPLSFKSYLTLFTIIDKVVKPLAFQHDFYISKSIRTQVSPKNVAEYQNKSPDLFYTHKATGYGKVIGGVAVATAVVGAGVIAGATQDTNTNTTSK